MPASDQRNTYIGLRMYASATGAYQESRSLLEKGIEKFDNNAMKAFLALSMYNLGEYKKAALLLMNLLLDTTSDQQLQMYQSTLSNYTDTLPDSIDTV